jgi:uncharacterized protein
MSLHANKNLQPEDVDFVIYHGFCPDGFSSALAVYKYFEGTGKEIEYFGACHGKEPPNVTGKNVLVCDFSYKNNVMFDVIKSANKLLIIDHHKSAEKELRSIDDKYKIFDMKHSGAYLTWKYFYPETEVPLFINYIEDHDIWLNKLPNTKEISCYTYSLPFQFTEYNKMLDDDYLQTTALTVGTGMCRQNDIYIKESMRRATHKLVKTNTGDVIIISYINSSVCKSDIGNRVLIENPLADFSAIYSLIDEKVSYSLRSMNNKYDVSEFASLFGGGGHRNAAGMTYHELKLPGSYISVDIKQLFNVDNICERNGVIIFDYDMSLNFGQESHIYNILHEYLTHEILEVLDDETTRPLQKCCRMLQIKYNNPTYYKNFTDFKIRVSRSYSKN